MIGCEAGSVKVVPFPGADKGGTLVLIPQRISLMMMLAARKRDGLSGSQRIEGL
jgi:hypothetical protein